MSASSPGVVIVGAGLGGIRVAESLRSNGYTDPITLIGMEVHPPYDRPPLSKSVLLGEDDRVDLKPQDFYGDTDITLRLDTRVSSIDTAAHTVSVVSGSHPDGAGAETIGYDTLVLATGLRPRPFPGIESGLAGVHVLRTYDDALALRAELDSARSAVVIGAGFIGCEVASSLHTRGLAVTLVEPAPTPLAAALGTEIGALVTRMHTEAGVAVRAGVGVRDIVAADGAVAAVVLDDGSELPADIVVVGIGSIPITDYLDGSGIELAPREFGGGIACDPSGHTSAADVYAVGDVANWREPDSTTPRVEHWNHTVEQAAIVGAEIAGGDAVTAAVPYFWSDQYGLKIQVLGAPGAGDTVHIVDDGPKFLAYYSRDGVLTAVVGAGKVGAVMRTRAKLTTPTPITEVIAPV